MFNETSLPEKEEFYSNLNLEDITDADYMHGKIPDHLYWILIMGGSGPGKTNALLNLINHEPDIDKIYLCAKDPYKKNINY